MGIWDHRGLVTREKVVSTLSAVSQMYCQWVLPWLHLVTKFVCDFEGQNLKVQLSVQVGDLRIAAMEWFSAEWEANRMRVSATKSRGHDSPPDNAKLYLSISGSCS